MSIPCVERFLDQDEDYRRALFPEGLPVATIEAGRTEPWKALAGEGGLTIGIDRFGASAPASVMAEQYGLTPEQVIARIRDWLDRR